MARNRSRSPCVSTGMLRCALCLQENDLFGHMPRVLPCKHILCHKCIINCTQEVCWQAGVSVPYATGKYYYLLRVETS